MKIKNNCVEQRLSFKDLDLGTVYKGADGKTYLKIGWNTHDGQFAVDLVTGKGAVVVTSTEPVRVYPFATLVLEDK